MTVFEYKVVPAPAKGQKARGVKSPQDRFANAVEIAINDLAAEGWEYLRAETLPNEERVGLTGSQTSYRSILIFRRSRPEETPVEEPRLLEAHLTEEAVADPAESQAPSPSEIETPEPVVGEPEHDNGEPQPAALRAER